ncbi:hypothetical protein [Candidatus Nitrospira bockiana]
MKCRVVIGVALAAGLWMVPSVLPAAVSAAEEDSGKMIEKRAPVDQGKPTTATESGARDMGGGTEKPMSMPDTASSEGSSTAISTEPGKKKEVVQDHDFVLYP